MPVGVEDIVHPKNAPGTSRYRPLVPRPQVPSFPGLSALRPCHGGRIATKEREIVSADCQRRVWSSSWNEPLGVFRQLDAEQSNFCLAPRLGSTTWRKSALSTDVAPNWKRNRRQDDGERSAEAESSLIPNVGNPGPKSTIDSPAIGRHCKPVNGAGRSESSGASKPVAT